MIKLSGIGDEERLLRRILRDQLSKHGRPHPSSFKLRLTKGETALSTYRASLVSAEQVCNAYPKGGAGVASFVAGELRAHFRVEPDIDPDDPVLGHAHAAVVPLCPESDGQISLKVRTWLSEIAKWETYPASS